MSNLPLTRRRFVGGSSAFVAATGLFGACSLESPGNSVVSGFDQLRVINWSEYIDPELIPVISEAIGASIDYDESFEDNQSALDQIITPALSGGNPGFDIIVPTNWLAARMIEQGWAEPLPLEHIPNHTNIDPAYLTNSWDRGSRFQMPWQAGITGVAYNPAATKRPVTSIRDLFSDEFAGRVALIGEMREAVGLAMLMNGDDPSNPSLRTAQAGLDVVTEAVTSGRIHSIVFNEFADLLAAGEIDVAMAWSGDTVLLQADRPDIEFVIPDEGAISWFDTMVIPAGAVNIGAAARFMNWAYDPANAAQITAWVQYISPVLGVQAELLRAGGELAELAQNPILFPDSQTRNRLFTWGSLTAADEAVLETQFNDLIR